MKKTLLSGLILYLFINMGFAQNEIKLYPKGAKESNDLTQEEHKDKNGFVTYVSEARMYSYIVPEEKASGAAVIICPGGGYWGLAAEKEGTEFAQWFNNLGISAFVLYYRMPNGHNEIPLTDAQTAIEIVRKNAKKWHIDKNKIGIAGFSAGGHLASTAGTHFTKKNRPDFMILLYPVITMQSATHGGSRNNLLGKDAGEELKRYYSNETQVKDNTPPAFIIHAKDDTTVPIQNAYVFHEALKQKNIPSELKVYETGGHGFGLRTWNKDSDKWPDDFKKWLVKNSFIQE